jgi:signal transduction histidine kinase
VKIHLISDNRQIQSLCHEIFAELLSDNWTLDATPDVASDSAETDLYVWDIDQQRTTFDGIEPREKWRHFFLVDRANVENFRHLIPFQGANILLKPVTKAALVAFFTDACNRCRQHADVPGDAFVENLRADRDEILQCLMEANLKLQEYDHDRTNFLARAIHDFRAPLTAVTGYCGLLLGEDIGPLTKDQREVLERMHRSAKKLSRMAGAMFQLSIAPRAEAAVDLQRGQIRDCIEHALHEILLAAEEKRLTILVETTPPTETLLFEKTKLEQVLVNLLENACKFTPRGGTIEVNGYPYFWNDRAAPGCRMGSVSTRTHWDDNTPNSYRVDIRDSGPGIPPTHLNKIFEEYTSYAGGIDRSGGGLGLAICRMVLDQHKGRIWAESSKDGAVFSFVLPFHREDIGLGETFSADALHARAY